jgi:hypothetical protein
VPCTTVADCNDHDECTTDTCSDGACAHEARPDCPAAPPHEICGNCIDDDGNGLTDYEDPACCTEELPLAVKRMLMKTIVAKARGNRLRLKARYTKSALALFDPMTQDTSIQIADAAGQLFCQTVAASHWKHPHRRLYRFKDKRGTFAGGLAMGRFKVKRNGAVIFRTRGKTVRMRYAGGKNVVVTLRVGNQCARETMNLRTTKKQALVFP